ncbi:hypothetical protein NDU88_005482 [Pleurodeles waltl]|uniref:Uncharacterized protein n=1 Tax=Pleurodeles waltl TaxID=8319 RepID=A0AAV7TUY7_PLEWA|nr:hypothetical protein NDU88_005482 [Pleurodeles waltl]
MKPQEHPTHPEDPMHKTIAALTHHEHQQDSALKQRRSSYRLILSALAPLAPETAWCRGKEKPPDHLTRPEGTRTSQR